MLSLFSLRLPFVKGLKNGENFTIIFIVLRGIPTRNWLKNRGGGGGESAYIWVLMAMPRVRSPSVREALTQAQIFSSSAS